MARWYESLSLDDREAPPTLPLPTTRKSSRGEGAERPVVLPAAAPTAIEMCAWPSAKAGTHTPEPDDVVGPAAIETFVITGPRLRGDDSGWLCQGR
jgi:hypothetical protein